ncbi:MAG: ATP-grasp domain-containing protein [Bacteroidetes bacterium]|nr:ATP-grasp domain-containing protein [Bacteroidota bacterium]
MLNDEPIRVAVLRGGVGHEYNVSLETGSYVLSKIPRHLYKAVDILIDRDGVWHMNGVSINPEDLSKYADLVFNCLHGSDGEDGRIQKFLERLGIPFVGSDSLASAMTGKKNITKERLEAIGYKTPKYALIQGLADYESEETRHDFMRKKAMEVFKKMHGPWIVKPVLGSASTHTYIVTTFAELISILNHLSDTFDEILVEEYMEGREVVAAVLREYRNEEHYVFPPKEVIKPGKVLDESIRRQGLHKVYVVGRSADSLSREIEDMTRKIHKEFNLSDFSLIEYIVSPKGIYVIEIDSVPILAHGEIIHDLLENIGLSGEDFVKHLIQMNI